MSDNPQLQDIRAVEQGCALLLVWGALLAALAAAGCVAWLLR